MKGRSIAEDRALRDKEAPELGVGLKELGAVNGEDVDASGFGGCSGQGTVRIGSGYLGGSHEEGRRCYRQRLRGVSSDRQ